DGNTISIVGRSAGTTIQLIDEFALRVTERKVEFQFLRPGSVLGDRNAGFGEPVGKLVRAEVRRRGVEAGDRAEQRARVEGIAPAALFATKHDAQRTTRKVNQLAGHIALQHLEGEFG